MKPLTPKFPHMLHGGDYNPDQWLDRPDILEEDIRLMKEAHINCVSVGIFAWAKLEPQEGVYDLTGWKKSLTTCMKTASTPCWPRPPAPSPCG